MRTLLLVLLLSGVCFGQATKPTNDLNDLYFVVFQPSAENKILNQWAQKPTDPDLQEIIRNSRVQIISEERSIYKERYSHAIEESRLPAIVVADKNGGVIYCCDKDTMPDSQYELAREIQHYSELVYNTPAISRSPSNPLNWPIKTSQVDYGQIVISQDCPDGQCPTDEPTFDEGESTDRKPWFPRLRPSRETSKEIMDGWFSTNNVGVSPWVLAGVVIVFLALFFRQK